MERAPIIVVVDGSPGSMEALRWAAWQSQETEMPLEVLHCYPELEAGQHADRIPSVHESRERTRATHSLQAALEESASLPYGLRLVVAVGTPVAVLAQHLRPGSLLVLGAHSEAGLLSWSSRKAQCPVVVVPAPLAGIRSKTLDSAHA